MPFLWILVVGLLCGATLGLTALVHRVFPAAGVFILALGLVLTMLGSLTIGSPNYLKGRLDTRRWSKLEEVAALFAGTVSSAAIFGVLCRELFLNGLLNFQNGAGAGYRSWIGFGFDNLFEAVLLDIPSLYNVYSSPIRPGAFWSATLMLLYRLAVDLVLFKMLISQIMRHRRL
jgi:hypothetical protein